MEIQPFEKTDFDLGHPVYQEFLPLLEKRIFLSREVRISFLLVWLLENVILSDKTEKIEHFRENCFIMKPNLEILCTPIKKIMQFN